MSTPITWDNANFTWDNNPHTWDEVQLVVEILRGGGDFEEEIYKSKYTNLFLQSYLIKMFVLIFQVFWCVARTFVSFDVGFINKVNILIP